MSTMTLICSFYSNLIVYAILTLFLLCKVDPQELSNSKCASMKLVCYYSLQDDGLPAANLTYDKIDPQLCTHIIVHGAYIINTTIQPQQETDLYTYEKIISLKKINPNLKVLLSLKDMNNKGHFSNLVKNETAVDVFAFNARIFLNQVGFDGLDLDWEFPALPAHKNNTDEKEKFAYLLMQLNNSLKLSSHPPLLLSVAVSSALTIIKRSYEVSKISKNVDFINLMGYDFRMFEPYFPFTGFNAPLLRGRFDRGFFASLNIAWAANYWVKSGAEKSKVIVGIPIYGRSWKLLSAVWNRLGAPAIGEGINNGYLSYPQVLKLKESGAQSHWDEYSRVPYTVLGKDWVSHEDERSIKEKAEWIKEQGFSGVMTWNLNGDDFSSHLSEEQFRLHRVIKEVIDKQV